MIKNLGLLIAVIILLGIGGIVNAKADSSEVFISEVNAWGSVNTDNCRRSETVKFTCGFDKWIELYNPTSREIDLKNYELEVGPSNKILNLSGQIPAKSYFVIKNKNQSLTTTLNKYDLELGFLQLISTVDTQNLNLKLLKESVIIDNKSGVADVADASNKRNSIEYQSSGIESAKLSQKIYKQIGDLANYGSPYSGILNLVNEAPKEVFDNVNTINILPVVNILPPLVESLPTTTNSVVIQPSTPLVESLPTTTNSVVIQPSNQILETSLTLYSQLIFAFSSSILAYYLIDRYNRIGLIQVKSKDKFYS